MKEVKSKYQQKHYQTIDFHLHNVTCPYCDKLFSIDIDQCSIAIYQDEARTAYTVFCPYCGKRHKRIL